MMGKRSLRVVAVTGAILALVMEGCSGDTDTADSDSNMNQVDAEKYSLAGKTIGIAVVDNEPFWNREAFQGAVDEVKRLGGEVLITGGGRDNAVHAQNHDTFLTSNMDAVITILGDASVEPKLKEIHNRGIPVFGVDHASENALNNSESDNAFAGQAAGLQLAKELGKGKKVAVFNAFSEALSFCGVRYQNWKVEIEKADIEILQPELTEQFANAPEDARKQTLASLQKHPKGSIDAIHVACWDQPAIGVVQAIKEAKRDDVIVSAIDAGPETLEIMMEDKSPFRVNVVQQPRLIAKTAVDNAAKHLKGEEVEKSTQLPVFPATGPDEAEKVYKDLGYDG